MKLRYERGALSDLDEIFSYITQDNPQAAARLVALFGADFQTARKPSAKSAAKC